MERLGTPTVAIGQESVTRYVAAKYNGWDFLYANGMPVRFVSWDYPVAGASFATHAAQLAGNDPISGKPIKQEIIDALTVPLTAEEKVTGTPPAATPLPKFLPADTEENLQTYFKSQDWTDYQPIIMPTEARVKAMLAGTSHKADEVLKTCNWPAGNRPLTVEKVAIAGVMAGCSPKYMPTLLAVAMSTPMGNSTTPMANAIVFNGPIIKELNINSGDNCMGPYAEANAVIGRFFTIISKTIGGLHGPNSPTGVTTFSSLGAPIQYNQICVAEAEDKLPAGWLTLAEELKKTRAQSTVAISTVWHYNACAGELQCDAWAPQDWMANWGSTMSGGKLTIFMDPGVASILAERYGFDTKTKLYEYWVQNVTMTVQAYWGNGVNPTFRASLARQGLEPYLTWWNKLYGGEPNYLIHPITSATGCKIIVCGGERNTIWFGTDAGLSSVREIDPWR